MVSDPVLPRLLCFSSSFFIWISISPMVKGTRIRTFDERLGVHEGKLTDLNGGLTKNREEVNHKLEEINSRTDGFGIRMDKMDNNFEELKQLILRLQIQGRDSEPRSIQQTEARRVATDLQSSNRSEIILLPPTMGSASSVTDPTPIIPPHATAATLTPFSAP